MEKLFSTELEYLKCFCQFHEDSRVIRFKDDMIGDMYSHNLTYIKHQVSRDGFQSIIEGELKNCINAGKAFLNVQFDFPYDSSILDLLEYKPSEVTIYDYYVFQAEYLEKLASRGDCVVRKLDNSLMEEALALDLRANGEDMGEDFIKRRFERRSKVYLSPGMVDNYICFSNGEAVGHCDLLLNKDVAKIEDVDVAPDHQRKGYGTVMLKEMINTALSQGAKTIYLITDHEDTAKDMYEKCGFYRAAQKAEMLFKV